MSPRDVWTNNDSFALTLYSLFYDEYVLPYVQRQEKQEEPDEVNPMEWDPETIALEIEDDHNIELPRLVHDRLMTAIALQKTDAFYSSLPDFIAFCNVLAGTPYGGSFDPADALEVAWGLTEALLIYPPDSDDPFNDEIRSYIGQALDREGIMQAPDILQIALRDVDPPDIQAEFSDDPTMFNAIYDMEASKTDDINRAIRENLRELVGQLQALPIKHGDATKANTLLQTLTRIEQEGDTLGKPDNMSGSSFIL
jgi:hypothetical protein